MSKKSSATKSESNDKPGVLAQHRDRMENDKAYRESALSLDADSPGGAALGKHVESTVPTKLTKNTVGVDS